MASKTALIVVGGVIVVAGGIAYALSQARLSPRDVDALANKIAKTPVGKAVEAAAMTEEERRAYVAAHVVVEGLEVGADTKEGEGGETVKVPGLLRVRGTVKNAGDRPVTPVTLQLLLLGKAEDDVLGAYLEDVSGGKRLEPGASRPINFTLPDKKEWGGAFKHSLR